MKIGIIGAGSMGRVLARHLGRLGHHVSIANSRGLESLTAWAAEIGATPVSVGDAAQAPPPARPSRRAVCRPPRSQRC